MWKEEELTKTIQKCNGNMEANGVQVHSYYLYVLDNWEKVKNHSQLFHLVKKAYKETNCTAYKTQVWHYLFPSNLLTCKNDYLPSKLAHKQ